MIQLAVLMNNEMRLVRRHSCRQEMRPYLWPCGTPSDVLSCYPSTSGTLVFLFLHNSPLIYSHTGDVAAAEALPVICLTLLHVPWGYCGILRCTSSDVFVYNWTKEESTSWISIYRTGKSATLLNHAADIVFKHSQQPRGSRKTEKWAESVSAG